jgi:hypothetical protein
MNTQDKLDDIDRVGLMLLNAQSEAAQLRLKVATLEIQAKYGNPGQPIEVKADGTILRLPPEFGRPLASVPEESTGP